MAEIKRPIFFTGENPIITLHVPDTEQIAAIASYWTCTDSQAGIGHALVLWLAEEKEGIGHGCIFTDNPELAHMLVENLTQHFPEFETVPVCTLPYVEANCGHTYDGKRYQAKCHTENIQMEITWMDILDRKQVVWPGFPTGEKVFDLTTVICPCRVGEIKINGNAINGEVSIVRGDDGNYSSTAFLAFAETWIGPFDKEIESMIFVGREA